MTDQFTGFPKKTTAFLAALSRNNDREWFKAHRERYERDVLGPARAYTVSMGERLRRVVPEIQAIPMVDRSIFRMHRDTRFSADKRPFKTHIGIFLWEGDDGKLDCPGFYLHLEKDKLLIGGGIHIFSKPLLEAYRRAVDDEKMGARLVRILDDGLSAFETDLDEDVYKRGPRGFPPDHPRASLLKKKGVTLGQSGPVPAELHTDAALDYVFERFEKIVPLHRWLMEMKVRFLDAPL